MKKTFLFMVLGLMALGQAHASDVLTVENVTLPLGGEATLEVKGQFGTQFKAYQFDIELDEGLALVEDANGKPVWELGFSDTDHSIACSKESEGKYRFVCTSMNNMLLPATGTILKVRVTGSGTMAVGDTFSGKVTATEFTDKDYGVCTLADAAFTVTVGEAPDTHVVLDETSTTMPEAQTGVDVRVKRTINAGEWSTICLPFAMTEAQVKTAFGDDAQVADFNDYEYDDATDAIDVKFVNVNAIEANHPYIIKVQEPVTEFEVDGVDIDPQDAVVDFDTSRRKNQPRQMVGNYVAGTTLDWGTLFLSEGLFWYSTGLTKMKAFRAYFNFYDLLADFETNYETRRISMSFDDSMTTGINQIGNRNSVNSKCYDLQGRRVEKPAKGLYIIDGKKVRSER